MLLLRGAEKAEQLAAAAVNIAADGEEKGQPGQLARYPCQAARPRFPPAVAMPSFAEILLPLFGQLLRGNRLVNQGIAQMLQLMLPFRGAARCLCARRETDRAAPASPPRAAAW